MIFAAIMCTAPIRHTSVLISATVIRDKVLEIRHLLRTCGGVCWSRTRFAITEQIQTRRDRARLHGMCAAGSRLLPEPTYAQSFLDRRGGRRREAGILEAEKDRVGR